MVEQFGPRRCVSVNTEEVLAQVIRANRDKIDNAGQFGDGMCQ
ncbi:unannotated protein [freshwater metagenome]|uniref:Unannotated protein n=1 Tax=freshwater metagenome TaxID=449393 RepID=A0A6J6HIH0_9ZZZZ